MVVVAVVIVIVPGSRDVEVVVECGSSSLGSSGGGCI